jgi:uncharacterized membrane protein YphA (DoxX/SURF4 family)
MTKTQKITYWVASLWFSLGMVSSGIVQLIPLQEEVERMAGLGYPAYFLTILGVWKLLGVAAILVPRYPLVKEWAYAGFFFLLTGAFVSHIVNKDPLMEYFGVSLLFVLMVVSYLFRPSDRKI